MGIKNISNPRWANVGQAIIVDVLYDNGEAVAYVAMENDVTDHGRQLFEAARDGQFGEVADEAVSEPQPV